MANNKEQVTQNPGSALGEAVGALMELALAECMGSTVAEHGAKLILRGPPNKRGGYSKLLLSDEHGIQYNIDGVIANEELKPIILLESKYIRYKKHNRDKGSWICHAHGEVRAHYSSIRSSIAVLAGSWSKSAVQMMVSHGINVFVVPFPKVVEAFAKHGIQFDWGEKDRHLAVQAWEDFCKLPVSARQDIGKLIVGEIGDDVCRLIAETLSSGAERTLSAVILEIHTNLGEIRRYKFCSREEACDFLEDFSIQDLFDAAQAISLFAAQPVFED